MKFRTSWEGARAPQWIEQAELDKGRLSGSNKLGRGQRKIGAPLNFDPERAPAVLSILTLQVFKLRLSGGTLGAKSESRPNHRCPLPSLFDPLRRPWHPSQLVLFARGSKAYRTSLKGVVGMSIRIERQSRTCRTLLAAALLFFFVSVQAQEPDAQAPAVKTGAITGRVVNESGQPLIGATISIRQAGTISLNEVQSRTLKVTFSSMDSTTVSTTSQQTHPLMWDRQRISKPPFPTYRVGDSVRLELVRGGVVTGTVNNATGEPMTGVRVRAFMIKDANGKATRGAIISLGERQTDDRGIYRIFGLSPGTYLSSSRRRRSAVQRQRKPSLTRPRLRPHRLVILPPKYK